MIGFWRNPPPVLQTTTSECGLACLTMIAQFHGKYIELFELRNQFVLSLRGMTMAHMVRIGKKLGFSSRSVRLEIENLNKLSTPCVLHWNMNHFVVLVKATRRKIKIYDPANGEADLTLEQASKHFTGVALEFFPAPDFKPEERKPSVGWRDLIGHVLGLRRSILQLIVMAGALQVLGLVAPWLTQWMVDGAIVSGDYNLLSVLILGFALIQVIQLVLSLGRSWCSLVLSTQINVQWSMRVMAHLVRLPATYFETRRVGDITSRFKSLDSIQYTITGALADTILDGFFAVATLVMLFIYSPGMATFILVAIAVYALIRIFSYRPLRLANAEYLALSAQQQSHLLESVRGYQSIKIGGLEESRCLHWSSLLTRTVNRSVKTVKMGLGFGAAYNIIFSVEQIVVWSIGASAVIEGSLSVGMLMAFIAYKAQFSSRMRSLIDRLVEFRLLDVQLERLADIVMTPKEDLEGSSPIELLTPQEDRTSRPCKIELIDVSFRYGEGEKWVLKGLNLVINPMEHIAIVGPSGCGKSTLIKLILGLLTPTEGEILVDGLSLQHWGLENWRRRLGVLMQDDQLFTGSIMDNIANFEKNYEISEVERAAQLASIHDEIASMPMGYRTYIGDMGSSLSGGQKQRVLLARAIHRRPLILVMDEATSHLDVDNERAVSAAISNLAITRIVVAHRPETIAMAERVVDVRDLMPSKKNDKSAAGNSLPRKTTSA